MVPDSDLLRRLNAGGDAGRPVGDHPVNDGPRGDPSRLAALAGALNIVVQDVCPGASVVTAICHVILSSWPLSTRCWALAHRYPATSRADLQSSMSLVPKLAQAARVNTVRRRAVRRAVPHLATGSGLEQIAPASSGRQERMYCTPGVQPSSTVEATARRWFQARHRSGPRQSGEEQGDRGHAGMEMIT
jgi:hypothetical protein